MSPVLELLDKISEEELDYSAPINQLPDSVLAYIFSMVGQYYVFTSARMVCKRWFLLGRDRLIWNAIDINGKICREKGVDAFPECVRYGNGITRLVWPKSTDILPNMTINSALKYLPGVKTIVSPNLHDDNAVIKLLLDLPLFCPDLKELDLSAVKSGVSVPRCAPLLKNSCNLKCLKFSLDTFKLEARFFSDPRAVLKPLEEIHIYIRSRGIFEEFLVAMIRANLRVTHLYFWCDLSTTSCNISRVREMPFLKSLSIHLWLRLAVCKISGFINHYMAFEITEGLNNVTSLSLYGAEILSDEDVFTDEGMKLVMQNMPQLEAIHLYYFNKLTNASLISIENNCTQLKEITIKCCKNITHGGVFSLIATLHRSMRKVNLAGFHIPRGSLAKQKRRYRHIEFHNKKEPTAAKV